MNAAARACVALLWCVAALAAPGSAAIQIRDAWVRWLPGNLPAGGYLTVINSGDRPISLTGATCEAYGSVSLHRSREQGGVANMSPVTAITVRPHATLEFAAEGYHLMLQQPKRALKPGDRIIITLTFASDAPMPVQFDVRSPDAS
jgi:periplasmic copper chaperone A